LRKGVLKKVEELNEMDPSALNVFEEVVMFLQANNFFVVFNAQF
jgi:hypothetical protein